MVQRGHAVDRVGIRQCCRGGRAERAQGPPAVRDPVDSGRLALPREQQEGEISGLSRVGLEPGRQRHRTRVDLLQIGRLRDPEIASSAAAAEHERLDGLDARRELRALRIGDDQPDLADRRLAGDIAIGAQHHRDGPEPVDRDHDRECRGS